MCIIFEDLDTAHSIGLLHSNSRYGAYICVFPQCWGVLVTFCLTVSQSKHNNQLNDPQCRCKCWAVWSQHDVATAGCIRWILAFISSRLSCVQLRFTCCRWLHAHLLLVFISRSCLLPCFPLIICLSLSCLLPHHPLYLSVHLFVAHISVLLTWFWFTSYSSSYQLSALLFPLTICLCLSKL